MLGDVGGVTAVVLRIIPALLRKGVAKSPVRQGGCKSAKVGGQGQRRKPLPKGVLRPGRGLSARSATPPRFGRPLSPPPAKMAFRSKAPRRGIFPPGPPRSL